jgi:hypothetical protein
MLRLLNICAPNIFLPVAMGTPFAGIMVVANLCLAKCIGRSFQSRLSSLQALAPYSFSDCWKQSNESLRYSSLDYNFFKISYCCGQDRYDAACGYTRNYQSPLHLFASLARGPDQIRTGVGAFAELSLATRPQDHIFRLQIYLDLIPIHRDESGQR